MVTGSHNPPDYNGFQDDAGAARRSSVEDIQALGAQMAAAGDVVPEAAGSDRGVDVVR